jgi:hypothetical protein
MSYTSQNAIGRTVPPISAFELADSGLGEAQTVSDLLLAKASPAAETPQKSCGLSGGEVFFEQLPSLGIWKKLF